MGGLARAESAPPDDLAPLTIGADASLSEAAAQLEANGVHRLVVLAADGRSPAGILSSSDIVRGMLERAARTRKRSGDEPSR